MSTEKRSTEKHSTGKVGKETSDKVSFKDVVVGGVKAAMGGAKDREHPPHHRYEPSTTGALCHDVPGSYKTREGEGYYREGSLGYDEKLHGQDPYHVHEGSTHGVCPGEEMHFRHGEHVHRHGGEELRGAHYREPEHLHREPEHLHREPEHLHREPEHLHREPAHYHEHAERGEHIHRERGKGEEVYRRGAELKPTVIEHVHPVEHLVEKLPPIEDREKKVEVRKNIIPEVRTEVIRHIHPVDKEIIKEIIHPKEVTEIHEKVHELQTKEVHEHIHPIVERQLHKDIYLPETRHVEMKDIDLGEVSREKVRGVPKGIDPNARVTEHTHHTKHQVKRVPVMQAVEKSVEVKTDVIPEYRTEVHRHIHPIEKDIVQEHIHPRDVTEIVENIHELRTQEIHEHVRPVKVHETTKDVYLPETRKVEEKFIEHGEVGRERVDVDLGMTRDVHLHEALPEHRHTRDVGLGHEHRTKEGKKHTHETHDRPKGKIDVDIDVEDPIKGSKTHKHKTVGTGTKGPTVGTGTKGPTVGTGVKGPTVHKESHGKKKGKDVKPDISVEKSKSGKTSKVTVDTDVTTSKGKHIGTAHS